MRRYYATVVGSLAVLLGLWIYGAHTTREAGRTNRALVGTVETLATVNSMIVALNQLEMHFESFAVTGDEVHLERWLEGKAEFERLATALESRIGHDSALAVPLQSSRDAFREWIEMQRATGILESTPEERRQLVLNAIDGSDWFVRGRDLVDRAINPLIAIQNRGSEQIRVEGLRTAVINTRADRAITALIAVSFLVALFAAMLLGRRSRQIQRNNRELREQMEARAVANREVQRLSVRQRLILDSAADGIIGTHQDGNVVFINPSATRMLGKGTLKVGDPVGGILEDGRTAETNPILSVLAGGAAIEHARGRFLRGDGTTFPVEYSSVPVHDHEGLTGSVLTFRDISERQEVDRLKNEFISIVSHELRTPLTSLRGSLGLLATGRLGELEPAGARMLDIAVESTDRLIRLVSDILDVERMESGQMTLQISAVDLQELARIALDQMQSMAQSRGVKLVLSGDSTETLADADRIVQVMTNLLSNAIKFSEPGASVEICISRDSEHRPRVQVTDTGRGIPADKLETVFNRFQQVDSTDARTHGGTGLGLAICRNIVEQHGGRIWAESEFGVGSMFAFVLPGPDAEPAVTQDLAQPSSVEPPLVLIWSPGEDHGAVSALHRSGYRTAQVNQRGLMVEEASRLQPEALLLELNEFGPEDRAVLRTLREEPSTKAIPIIVLSYRAPIPNVPEAGAITEWLEAPIEPEELVDAVISARLSRNPAKHILIVEDDVDLARMLGESFAQHGIPWEHAETGRDALVMALQSPPALVVLDLMLPEGNGEWVVAWMRRLTSLRNTSLVVYSARDIGPEERARLRLGRTAFLTKGEVAPEEFEKQVLSMFRRMSSESRAEVKDGKE